MLCDLISSFCCFCLNKMHFLPNKLQTQLNLYIIIIMIILNFFSFLISKPKIYSCFWFYFIFERKAKKTFSKTKLLSTNFKYKHWFQVKNTNSMLYFIQKRKTEKKFNAAFHLNLNLCFYFLFILFSCFCFCFYFYFIFLFFIILLFCLLKIY